MRIFITGATGFIGYLVTRLLREQQYDIHALVCPVSEVAELKKLGVELTRISLPGCAGTIASST
jgi:thioester reductase-like protein